MASCSNEIRAHVHDALPVPLQPLIPTAIRRAAPTMRARGAGTVINTDNRLKTPARARSVTTA
jgi:hypothetical protein